MEMLDYFENMLKEKLERRSSVHQSQEKCLLKLMKEEDLAN